MGGKKMLMLESWRNYLWAQLCSCPLLSRKLRSIIANVSNIIPLSLRNPSGNLAKPSFEIWNAMDADCLQNVRVHSIYSFCCFSSYSVPALFIFVIFLSFTSSAFIHLILSISAPGNDLQMSSRIPSLSWYHNCCLSWFSANHKHSICSPPTIIVFNSKCANF